MVKPVPEFFAKKYPQNFIIEKPYIGTLVFLAFCLTFVILYKPLNLHGSRSLGYELTMAVYLCTLSLPIFFSIKILKTTRYFSNPHEWSILKELTAIAIILFGMGIALYFFGFLFELPSDRWNLPTFFDSCKHAFLVGIIPFMFFTLTNYRYLFAKEIVQDYKPVANPTATQETEELLKIESSLKKEEVSFYPSQLVYAESDGNYVVFHLDVDGRSHQKMVRNSMNNIEQQLTEIPFFMRTHRAFIVNLRKIRSKKGNTLGYRLKFSATDAEIPVSRQNTHDFDQIIKRYH